MSFTGKWKPNGTLINHYKNRACLENLIPESYNKKKNQAGSLMFLSFLRKNKKSESATKTTTDRIANYKTIQCVLKIAINPRFTDAPLKSLPT